MTWKPLLEGALAERAQRTSSEIAEALRSVSAGEDASYATGTAGLAVCFATLADAGAAADGAARAGELLDHAVERMAEEELEASLFGGIAGIGWAFSRLAGGDDESDEGEEDDALADVDAEVLTRLRRPWTATYDLVSGLVGLGVYALERLPRKAARETLERIVDHFAATAEDGAHGLTWHTPNALLSSYENAQCPGGYYNLGLAHGVPGVLALLAQASAAGIAPETTRRLAEGAVEWLLAQRQPRVPAYDYWTGDGAPKRPSRSAWCYGDVGIAAALVVASQALAEPAWEKEALSLASGAAARPFEDSGFLDAGICHGTAGVAHIFNRIHQATGDEGMRRAAVHFVERTLDLRAEGSGLAGYVTAWKNRDGELQQVSDPSLLNGVAGIALVLASAATDVEPVWDRTLLLSSAPRG